MVHGAISERTDLLLANSSSTWCIANNALPGDPTTDELHDGAVLSIKECTGHRGKRASKHRERYEEKKYGRSLATGRSVQGAPSFAPPPVSSLCTKFPGMRVRRSCTGRSLSNSSLTTVNPECGSRIHSVQGGFRRGFRCDRRDRSTL